MDSLTRAGYYPGVVTLVRDHQRTVTLTSGVARRHPRQTLTAQHRFPVASATKSLVAAETPTSTPLIVKPAPSKALEVTAALVAW